MRYIILWGLLWAVIGSFGTAYLHQRTGRDVQMGGLIGGIVGAIGGIFFLMILWVWLYYGSAWHPVGRLHNPRHVWYRWWE